MQRIEHDAVQLFFRAELAPPPPQELPEAADMHTGHQEVTAYGQAGGAAGAVATATAAGRRPQPDQPGQRQPVQRSAAKVGRNDPCPCGSGKKYKKCHGR